MKKICFRNGFAVEIDFENTCVHRVAFQNEQLTQGDNPFYAVKLRKRDGKSRIISAAEGEFISFDGETALTALKNFNAWRKAGGKNYLHYGKMGKPLSIQCGTNGFIDAYGKQVVVDEALTSAYEYSGRTLQFIANYNLHPVTVSLVQSVTVYKNPEMTDIEYGVSMIEVSALSAVAVEVCK